MKRYTHLLFDLDGTLFDFDAAERAALEKTCHLLHIPYNEDVLKAYTAINEGYWKLFEQNKITQPELAVRRFADLYTYLHLSGDANEANLCYRKCLAEAGQIFPDTMPVIQTLSKNYHIALITNGIADVQYGRLSLSPLKEYSAEMYVSESVGSQKPQKEYFDYVYKKLNINASQALVIGDSLTSDILGAQNSSTDSCWFNPKSKINTYPNIHPTYEIHSLTQLLTLLNND